MTEIESEPVDLGIYQAGDGPFDLFRYEAGRWSKCGGWSGTLEAPRGAQPVRLVAGPVLVIGLDEPRGVGAVVQEFRRPACVFVRMPDGQWRLGDEMFSWSQIEHPVLLTAGVRV